jgi:hypothetical protein
MNNLYRQAKEAGLLSPAYVATYITAIIYLIAWYQNGANGAHYSCSDLLAFYGTFIVGHVMTHGINSALNSPKGEPPTQK